MCFFCWYGRMALRHGLSRIRLGFRRRKVLFPAVDWWPVHEQLMYDDS